MKYTVIAETDIGIKKETNQDSLLIRHARKADGEEVVLAIVCDGMGGLSKGELASATVIRSFAEWFEKEFPYELANTDMHIIGSKWSLRLKDLNQRLLDYSQPIKMELGTTFTGMLLVGDKYVIAHVGDSRVYELNEGLVQLTTDQTFVAREISRGTITLEEAKRDKRRNMLLQCIGASKIVDPQVICGNVTRGAYLLCSDGFRHEVTEEEIYESLNPVNLISKDAMQNNVRYLIEQDKKRQERDNISAILIKAE